MIEEEPKPNEGAGNAGPQLESFLSSLRADGAVQGQGQFSIDLLVAEKRLAGLENQPGLFLVKLVQAAVAAGAQGMDIRLDQQRVQVEISSAETLFLVHEIQGALHGPFISHPRPAVTHLAWAFLLAHPWEDLKIKSGANVFQASQGWTEEPGSGAGLSLLFKRHGNETAWLAGLKNATVLSQEHLLLMERCCYAPIAVKVDERLVNNPEYFRAQLPPTEIRHPNAMALVLRPHYVHEPLVDRKYLASHGPRFLGPLPTTRDCHYLSVDDQTLAVVPQDDPGFHSNALHLSQWLTDSSCSGLTLIEESGLSLNPEARLREDRYPLFYGSKLFKTLTVSAKMEEMRPYLSRVRLSSNDEEPVMCTHYTDFPLPMVSRRVILPLGIEGPARLIPILHGVALDPLELPDQIPGLVALVSDDQLAADLSHLKAVDNEVVEQMRHRVSADGGEMAQAALEILKPRFPSWICERVRQRLSRL